MSNVDHFIIMEKVSTLVKRTSLPMVSELTRKKIRKFQSVSKLGHFKTTENLFTLVKRASLPK